jgi:hypothetical protein
MALQPVLDTLPPEEDSEGETEIANIKDFTVSVLYCGGGRVSMANPWSGVRPVGSEGFLPQGRGSKGIVSHERRKSTGTFPNGAISPLITNQRVCRRYPLITGEFTT